MKDLEALIGPELRGQLDELRKFRHFFRNAYDRPLDPAKVAANVGILFATHGIWLAAIRDFLDWVQELSARLREDPDAPA